MAETIACSHYSSGLCWLVDMKSIRVMALGLLAKNTSSA